MCSSLESCAEAGMCSCSTALADLLAIEEYRVSNENVEEQDERFQDVHHLYLPVTAKDMVVESSFWGHRPHRVPSASL